MGQVYLAADTKLDRQVAIKVLSEKLAGQAFALERFLREAKLASALSHPNITHIYEIGEAAGVPYLVMEFVSGEPLSRRIARGPITAGETSAIGAQVADALEAAHAKNIVHRDIKPANIMIGVRGHVKVLDFGLAKLQSKPRASEETQFLTREGVVVGTVNYMSPEQALGEEADARSDIFSLGAVLYEMCTGRAPFSGLTVQETVGRLIEGAPEAIARFRYDVPDGLDRIVRKSLQRNRDQRYQSAREMAIDLRAMDEDSRHEPGKDPGPGAAARGRRITAVIVDDEELARRLLREYLGSVPDIRVVAECANGFEAVKTIAEHKPDLVFLDVQMPKLDGFEVLELIGRDVAVIFTTAYDTYAMKAFDAHAVDYLLKPFRLERFQKAVERALRRIGSPTPPAAELAARARGPSQYAARLVVKEGTKVHVIPADHLDYAEAEDDYVSLHSEGKSYLKQQTISSLESALDPRQFVRIHRSYLVNLERVARIEPYAKESRVAVLTDGTQLPVSRAGYDRLKALLDERR